MITKVVIYKFERDTNVRITVYKLLGIKIYKEMKDAVPESSGQYMIQF